MVSVWSTGDHNVLVNTWRPTGRRLIDKMRRFFIGGGPELEELSYIAQPRDFSVSYALLYHDPILLLLLV